MKYRILAWEQRKLGDIAPLRGGFPFQSNKYLKSGVPIIWIANVLSNGTVGGNFVYYQDIKEDTEFKVESNDALIAMSGATTGKVATLN